MLRSGFDSPNRLVMKIHHRTYLHKEKWKLLDELTDEQILLLSPSAKKELIHALYEVEVELRIDTETGEYEIISFK